MPLNHGNTKSAVSKNIKLLVGEWQESGAIGTSHPRSKKKAIAQAVAIALSTADRSRSKRTDKTGKD